MNELTDPVPVYDWNWNWRLCVALCLNNVAWFGIGLAVMWWRS